MLRYAILCHRWLGVVLCPLVIVWFASGIVMMYSGFPEVSQDDWFATASRIEPDLIRISPANAYGNLHWTGEPDGAEITVLDGRPAFRFRAGRERGIVFADNGEILDSLTEGLALRVAARWTKQSAERARRGGAISEPDQWTVSGEYRPLRPLFLFSWPDGEEVYVSSRIGEVVQHTTPKTRWAAYFGAIPHWLYWTPLRKNGRQWNRVVVWSSSALILAGLLGLLVGAWMLSPSRNYAYRGAPSRVPYTGQKRLHMILGLVFGLLTCTWAFSGLLSMEPFEWLSGNQESVGKVDAALRGGAIQLEAFAAEPPSTALERSGLEAKRIEFVSFDGRPYYLIRNSPSVSRLIPPGSAPMNQFDSVDVLRVIKQATQPAAVEEARVVSRYDNFYLDRHGRHPLPAFLVRVDDAEQSAFYVDLKTAQLVEAYDRRSRWNRWLYHGLHSWNFLWLYSHRPAWDAVVLVLLLGGLSLGITALLLAFQVVMRALRSTARNGRKISRPQSTPNLS